MKKVIKFIKFINDNYRFVIDVCYLFGGCVFFNILLKFVIANNSDSFTCKVVGILGIAFCVFTLLYMVFIPLYLIIIFVYDVFVYSLNGLGYNFKCCNRFCYDKYKCEYSLFCREKVLLNDDVLAERGIFFRKVSKVGIVFSILFS